MQKSVLSLETWLSVRAGSLDWDLSVEVGICASRMFFWASRLRFELKKWKLGIGVGSGPDSWGLGFGLWGWPAGDWALRLGFGPWTRIWVTGGGEEGRRRRRTREGREGGEISWYCMWNWKHGSSAHLGPQPKKGLEIRKGIKGEKKEQKKLKD